MNLWASQAGTPLYPGRDARVITSDGVSRANSYFGQGGWDMGMNFSTLDDLVAQLTGGAQIPDWVEDDEREASGCSAGLWIRDTLFPRRLPGFIQRCAGPIRNVQRGEIRRLALHAHGRPGELLIDGANQPGITAERLTYFRARLGHLFEFTTYDAVVLFMGCTAGQADAGTSLLRRLSEVWSARTFVAFTTVGVSAGRAMHRSGRGIESNVGMRDSPYAEGHVDGYDYTDTPATDEHGHPVVRNGHPISEWEHLPWASETSPHAKVIRNGVILHWGNVVQDQAPNDQE
jgi:hypothetical protein